MFSFFHDGKATALDTQLFRFYSQTLINLKLVPSTDGSGSGSDYPVLPYCNQDDPAFMPHKYIYRAFWHHACEVLFQGRLKFYRQPTGAQLPGYSAIKAFQGGSFDGSKYVAAWAVIETFNGRNSSLDYAKIKRNFELLEYDPRINDFTYFLKA